LFNDFIKNPELLLEPEWAVLSAFWFWKVNKLEVYADKGQFKELCAVWNTGRPNREPNHYKERVMAYRRVLLWLNKKQ
jgi:putative chitinase